MAAWPKMKGAKFAMKTKQKYETVVVARRSSVLRFSPTAWAKLLFLRDVGDTEIGGFAITPPDDLLYVEDLRLVQQTCDWAHVEFDDASVADFFDQQVDEGRQPQEFARIWLHTHPGDSPQPSGTDEATFARVFGRSDWALMFILARGGACYARLRFNVGPGADVELPVEIDYGRPFQASDAELWKEEYLACVHVPPPIRPKPAPLPSPPVQVDRSLDDQFVEDWWRDAWADYTDFDRYPQEAEYGYIRDFQ